MGLKDERDINASTKILTVCVKNPVRYIFIIFTICACTYSYAHSIDPLAWQRLQELDGHVLEMVCPTNEKCGVVPIILRKTSPDRLDFELRNATINEFYLSGACLSRSGPCSKVKDQLSFSTLMVSLDSHELTLAVNTLGVNRSTTITLKESPYFYDVKLNPFKGNPTSQRMGQKAASEFWRSIEQPIFRLAVPPPESDKFIYGENSFTTGGQSYGTGFYISPDGYALTNWHVVMAYSGCLPNYGCELTIGTQTKDGKLEETPKHFRLVAIDRYLDVALLKSDDVGNVQYLSFENVAIGPDIVTVGYPSDREKNEEGPLAYSFGQFNGFYGSGFAFLNSAPVATGASGSPLLNKVSGKVIGIISNGDINTSLARPIHIVSKYLGLTDYLNGKKELRVRSILKSLEAAKTRREAFQTLERLKAEHTLLLGKEFEELEVTHPVLDVRREISLFLKRQARANGPR